MRERVASISRRIVKNPLFSGSFIMVAGSMIANVVNYVYHLVMGRMLGPVDYGILASLFSILYIFGIVPHSSSVAIVKFISSALDKKELVSTYHGIKRIILNLAVFLSLTLIITSPLIARFLHIDNFLLVVLIAPVIFFGLITLVNQATSQGELRFFGFVVPVVISSVCKLVFGLLLVYLGFEVFGAMTGIVIASFLAFVSSLPYVRKFKKRPKTLNFDKKNFYKYTMPVLIQSLVFTSFFTTDLILVKHFLSPLEAGLYAALSTLGKIIFFAVSPITSTMFPIVAKRKSRGEKYINIFIVSLVLTAGISLLVLAVFYLFPEIAIGVLYGKDYLIVAKELVWMGVFMFFYTVSFVSINYLLSINITKVVIIPLVAAVAQVVGIVLMHNSILQVIQVSLSVMVFSSVAIGLFLMYNRLVKNVEEK